MSFKYHIDGTQEFGYSPIKRFEYSFYMFENLVNRVRTLYPKVSVMDIKAYAAYYCYVRLVSFDTLKKVLLVLKDYVTANCILRMLGDCVANFRLIYLEPDADFLRLRHALYIIDGCKRNLTVLPEEDINKGSVPDIELAEANRQIYLNREHRQNMICEAQRILDASPLKAKDEKAFNKIVKDCNWKFKKFEYRQKTNENQYKWSELYEMIGCCKYFDLLSYISQYAHGLSMSNLEIKVDDNNVDGVLSEAVGLIDTLYEYAYEFFEDDYKFIFEGLLVPQTRQKLLLCFDPIHRPNVASWDMGVINKIKEASLQAASQYN